MISIPFRRDLICLGGYELQSTSFDLLATIRPSQLTIGEARTALAQVGRLMFQFNRCHDVLVRELGEQRVEEIATSLCNVFEALADSAEP